MKRYIYVRFAWGRLAIADVFGYFKLVDSAVLDRLDCPHSLILIHLSWSWMPLEVVVLDIFKMSSWNKVSFWGSSLKEGSFAAALVSSLNIGSAIADKFQGESSSNIGLLELICLILQDDIMKMSNTLEQARNGSQKINELLKQKLLSLNCDKSKGPQT